MRITIAEKKAIAARMGISPEAFAAYQRREREKRKARKLMTPDERRAFDHAEAERRQRVAAEAKAARLKRDGITTTAYKEITNGDE
jgi:hypothetical protein